MDDRHVNITGNVEKVNINTGDNAKQSIRDSESGVPKRDDSKWSWNLGHVLTAITITIATFSATGIWYKYFSDNSETCTHSVMLYDQNTRKVIKNNATIYFLYQNDKYTFYGDSEGYYKAKLGCDQNDTDGKIHVEAEGYQVYERGFKLSNNMQEIRLSPAN